MLTGTPVGIPTGKDERMSSVSQLMTADELERLPDDGQRHELVRGELRTMPPAGFDHGAKVVNLTLPLAQHVRAQQLGVVAGAETGFVLARNPDTVRAPDIAFVRQERIPAAGNPRGFWDGAPDLAVEVVSPGDTFSEVEEKVDDWLAAGTRMVWVVNPRRRTVTVYRSRTVIAILTPNDVLDSQDFVPGFACRVADIFV
jgi:Uma2 family endonuclease